MNAYSVLILWIAPIGYFRAAEGTRCSENEGLLVDDVQTCDDAVKELGLYFIRSEYKTDRPKGCYDGGGVYFNQHSIGNNTSWTRQICKPRGK